MFLLAESKYPGCTRLAEILGGMSHDSVNRFLVRERYEPKDLFDEVKLNINLNGGILSGDDTIIDKPYSDPQLTELIGDFWSGKHHRVVKGIQLITLYYTDGAGKSVPVNYRLYNKQERKTKNEYLRSMIVEVLDWGLQPKIVTTDAWYSSRENLNFLKNKNLGCLMGVAKNRKVSINGRDYIQVQHLEIHGCWFSSASKKFWKSASISENLLPRGDASRTKTKMTDTTLCIFLIKMNVC